MKSDKDNCNNANNACNNYSDYLEYLKTKKVAVVGLGIGNIDLFKFLAEKGVYVTGFDKRTDFDELIKLVAQHDNAKLVTGDRYLDRLIGFDIIYKTQSMRRDLPSFVKEIEKGAILTSEMYDFMRFNKAKTIAVTGSSGKTTTTTLIGEFLKQQGYKVWVGGNIGTPLFHKINEINKDDFVVLELASCQLQMFGDLSPDISIVTNITPNHLDFHDSYDEYIYSKSKIFIHQKPDDTVILNKDNDITNDFKHISVSKTYMFSRTAQQIDFEGAYIKDGAICVNMKGKQEKILDLSDIVLAGTHNVENYMAAITAVYNLVDKQTVKHVANTFKGVEHRTEYVRRVSDIRFYNDSIGTTPSRTVASVNAFSDKVILITGGYDKNIPYAIMGPLINEKIKGLVVMGQTKDKILQAYKDYECTAPYKVADSLEQAVKYAYDMAKPGDTVILSPASASYDMFRNFEEKGNLFKHTVNSLIEKNI